MAVLLRARGINKSFPGVRALIDVDFDVEKGEIHALAGENGAGKSTLMKILSGVYTRDSGELVLDGKVISFSSPREAFDKGIAIIHQELNLAPNLSIAKNIYLGRYAKKGKIFFDEKKTLSDSKIFLDELGFCEDPGTLVSHLTIAKQQMVEIAKALSVNSRILIMDEPTSALNVNETNNLFRIMRSLKDRGVSIIYISHRIDEMFVIADRITIMKDGRIAVTKPIPETNHEDVVHYMTGKSLDDYYSTNEARTVKDREVLRVENLSQKKIVHNVSFSLKEGEILGIAGLLGSGRTELLKAIFGADRTTSGKIFLNGKEMNITSPCDSVMKGIAFLPEDRKLEGLHIARNIRDNIALPSLKRFAKMGFVDLKRHNKDAKEMINAINIKTQDEKKVVKQLSGGNQQKVVFAKWLEVKPKVLLLDDPTRGVDVGAKAEIYRLIRDQAAKGMGIIFVSSELPEVLGVSDRVLLINEGSIIGELSKSEMNEETVMLKLTRYRKNKENAESCDEPAKERVG